MEKLFKKLLGKQIENLVASSFYILGIKYFKLFLLENEILVSCLLCISLQNSGKTFPIRRIYDRFRSTKIVGKKDDWSHINIYSLILLHLSYNIEL